MNDSWRRKLAELDYRRERGLLSLANSNCPDPSRVIWKCEYTEEDVRIGREIERQQIAEAEEYARRNRRLQARSETAR